MMATASAVAMPASPDIIMPSQPSGLSSARKPTPLAAILRNEVTESPGSSAAWAAPFSKGVVIFIAASRGCVGASSRPKSLELSLVGHGNGHGGSTAVEDLLSGGSAVAIAGARAPAGGEFRCQFK